MKKRKRGKELHSAFTSTGQMPLDEIQKDEEFKICIRKGFCIFILL